MGLLSGGHLSGRIDTARPQLGIHDVRLRGSEQPELLLGVYRGNELATAEGFTSGAAATWPLPLQEAYVRGADLVASYRPVAEWPFSPQLYWQANALRSVEGAIASVSLLVSVQTDLLETCPRIGVTSRLSRGESWLLSAKSGQGPRADWIDGERRMTPAGEICCIISRFEVLPYTYVEIVLPGDFHEMRLRSSVGGITTEWRLFAEFLEKGVIRRARVHAVLLPREDDLELAAACCEAAERLELPLTT
jgi:hypothetical protein